MNIGRQDKTKKEKGVRPKRGSTIAWFGKGFDHSLARFALPVNVLGAEAGHGGLCAAQAPMLLVVPRGRRDD
jgi:hypothetical protein